MSYKDIRSRYLRFDFVCKINLVYYQFITLSSHLSVFLKPNTTILTRAPIVLNSHSIEICCRRNLRTSVPWASGSTIADSWVFGTSHFAPFYCFPCSQFIACLGIPLFVRHVSIILVVLMQNVGGGPTHVHEFLISFNHIELYLLFSKREIAQTQAEALHITTQL